MPKIENRDAPRLNRQKRLKPEPDFATALATFEAASATVKGWRRQTDDDPAWTAAVDAEADTLAALIQTPARTVGDVRTKIAAQVAVYGELNETAGEFGLMLDADLARLEAEPDPEARCQVAPIAREAARICRAIATVEKAEDAAPDHNALPADLGDMDLTPQFVRSFYRRRLEALTAHAATLPACSPIGLAFQVMSMNFLVLELIDQAEFVTDGPHSPKPNPHEVRFRDVEWSMRHRLAVLLRGVAPAGDPDLPALEAEFMPQTRADLARLEAFAAVA